MAVPAGVDQVCGNAHLLSVMQERSLQDCVHMQLTCDLIERDLGPLVVHHGTARDDPQGRAAGKICDQLISHSVDDIILIRTLGKVDERKYSHRLIRERRTWRLLCSRPVVYEQRDRGYRQEGNDGGHCYPPS